MSKLFKKNYNFIERSLLNAAAFLKEATICEQYASIKGFVQGLDPRIKTFIFFIFIILTVSLKNLSLIIILYFLSISLAFFSNLSLKMFLLRTWIFIPLFSFLITIPVIFNFITPGADLWKIQINTIKISITYTGVASAVLFIMRVATSVSFAILFSLTTKHAELLKSLRNFGVPVIFIMTLSMCYRYLYLFSVIVENLFLAIKSRVGYIEQHKINRNIVAWNIANTWNKTNQMSEDVYNAMLSRGYTGEPKSLNQFKIKTTDWFYLLVTLIISTGLFYLDINYG